MLSQGCHCAPSWTPTAVLVPLTVDAPSREPGTKGSRDAAPMAPKSTPLDRRDDAYSMFSAAPSETVGDTCQATAGAMLMVFSDDVSAW